MKTVLIATDFSLESLNVLKKVLQEKDARNEKDQYKILLVSGYEMGDSIRDLLFTTKNSVFEKIRSQEFCDACSIIENKYPHLISKIKCDIFTGAFVRAFKNYLVAENVDEIFYTDALQEKNTLGKFDLVPYIRKSKFVEAKEVQIATPKFMPEKGRLAEVFAEV